MAAWPTSVATDTELYLAKNNVYSSLNGAINSAVTSLVLTDASAFPSSGAISIDNEVIFYASKSTNTLNSLTRGADGTTAASHTDGRIAMHRIVAAHHNALKDELIAVENSLNLTASRAIVTNGSGRLAVATTTATEVGYLNGVTSAIQTQLNLKAPLASPTFSGTITTPLTASRAIVTGASSELAASAATATEVSYLSGVTSAIQTQLDAKLSSTPASLAITNTTNQLTLGTTRTVTLTAPTPASASRTVTIPDLAGDYSVVGTIAAQSIAGVKTFTAGAGAITMSSSTIAMGANKITGIANGTASSDVAAFGQVKVIQVVSATSTTEATTTSGTYANTNLSASITPTSASNKILILATSMVKLDATGATGNVTLARGGSNLLAAGGGAEIRLEAGTGPLHTPCAITFMDSPASTSSLTYTTQIKTSGSTMRYGTSGTQSMILVEVAS